VFDKASVSLVLGDKLLLCSDGLWGTLSDEEIVQRLAAKSVSQAVPELVESALRAGGERCDNVTVLAMEWETPDVFAVTQNMAIDTLGGDFASTIQSSHSDSMADDLDEKMIERSIAEINEAIRRTAAKKS
jgi:serine/threonine protein phosphatase PrpC